MIWLPKPLSRKAVVLKIEWKLFNFVILVSGCLISSGCVERLDLHFPIDQREDVVIQGRIVKSEQPYAQVRVSRLFDFTANGVRPIYGSQVIIQDTLGNQVELLREEGTENFVHRFDASDQLRVGYDNAYQLEVTLPDGRHYESPFERLVSLPSE